MLRAEEARQLENTCRGAELERRARAAGNPRTAKAEELPGEIKGNREPGTPFLLTVVSGPRGPGPGETPDTATLGERGSDERRRGCPPTDTPGTPPGSTVTGSRLMGQILPIRSACPPGSVFTGGVRVVGGARGQKASRGTIPAGDKCAHWPDPCAGGGVREQVAR